MRSLWNEPLDRFEMINEPIRAGAARWTFAFRPRVRLNFAEIRPSQPSSSDDMWPTLPPADSPKKHNAGELQSTGARQIILSIVVGALFVAKQGGRTIGVYMVAASLEVNDAPNSELHALWIDLSKVVEQISSAGEYADDGADDLARCAALEGITSLRLGFTKWLDAPTYRQFAVQERAAYGADDAPEEASTLLDTGLRRLCAQCAVEIRECEAIPAAARKQLIARLQEVEEHGAAPVLALVAQAAVVERALKARAR